MVAVGRRRKRERLARQAGLKTAGPTVTTPALDDGERRLHDPAWRKAERRRVARLNRLPDPFRSWGDRSRGHAFAIGLLQGALVTVVGLLLLKLTTGTWLPPYAAVVVLALAVVSQAVCRSINKRADAKVTAAISP